MGVASSSYSNAISEVRIIKQATPEADSIPTCAKCQSATNIRCQRKHIRGEVIKILYCRLCNSTLGVYPDHASPAGRHLYQTDKD